MAKLSVNLNAVAQLRNRRNLPWPSVPEMARLSLGAGAGGITVHPRPDERHIRRTDVFELNDLLRDEWPDRELNIEGYPTEAFLKLCEVVRPDQVTLVPDDPDQATSDHGWDLATHAAMLAEITERLQNGAMRVSLFIDADPAMPALAAEIGADRVELYTGPYGDPRGDTAAELARLRATAEACRKAGLRAARGGAGLGVNAGHDLTLDNLPALLAAIPDLDECSIGHALTADALKFGFAETVRKYIQALTV
ncbi:MAG: pyridoxine 5'-phosphate synthase [Devosia sp. 67-54]|uniref:pyridoxine 5'-phosphate synthase n=1 Tax=unclassified Devosia TaxID=196773 RepID=UPI00095C8B98|nr:MULTISPECIES: pyridoxine 5'-phosphate synthase [unclassified Devosia]MBN9303922.1 pyridoxine 5'-phosphate synthase [Devosia sp.]OJX17769.1 MAG: pyridoxine 5'-phosphate synthase [Devosia sp. 67-54]